MNENTFIITREKHLDHMVKVVPLIVLGHGMHCYILNSFMGDFGTQTAIVLGLCLFVMIGGFMYYDSRQKTILHEDHLNYGLWGDLKQLNYSEILTIEAIGPEKGFGTIIIHGLKQKKLILYFVDDPHMIKEWINSKRLSSPSSLAA